MDYLVAVLLPQLLHGVVFGAALGLLALGLTVIFGLLGVMNFAHGELYMFGAYAGIAAIGLTQSFWIALIAAPLVVAAIGAVTEMTALRPLYRREPLYGLIMTFGLAIAFREIVRQLFGGDMRRIMTPIDGSVPLLGMTYPRYRLFLLGFSSLLLLVFVPKRPPLPRHEEASGLLAGVRFIFRDELLRPMMVTIVFLHMFAQSIFIALPVLAYDHYGASARTAGLLFGAWGAGSIIGSLAAIPLAKRMSPQA